METLTVAQISEISGGGNRSARFRVQSQRNNLYGGMGNRSTFNCVSASVFGAGMSLFGPLGTMAGAGFAAYVCSRD